MATQADTVEFLLDQLSMLPGLSTRKMFGEYALYCETKVVGFVCDDELFVKPTDVGRRYVEAAGALDEAPAYPGSKLYLRVTADRWEDREWLSTLIDVTAEELPLPQPKKPRRKTSRDE